MKSGEKEYHFIEVMGCPGGCVTGGGQPIVPAQVQMEIDVHKARAAAIYDEDRALPVRKSHENESVKKSMRNTWVSPTATRLMNCCIPTTHQEKDTDNDTSKNRFQAGSFKTGARREQFASVR